MKFADLQLDSNLQSALEKINFTECTPIQESAIPVIQSGKDVAGLAQTGTGKTGAFLIPLMDRILKGKVSTEGFTEEQLDYIRPTCFLDWKRNQFVLVLVPTRELAEQVLENLTRLGSELNIRGCAIYGGTGYDKQKQAIKDGVEFVIATPGRLIDLYKEHFIDLKQVRAIVFDEADRMFDMGFKDDMKYILQRIPKERQFLVFSATLNFDVLNTAYQFGAEPVEISLSRDQAKAENVKDEIFHIGQEEKPKYLLSILKKHNPKQTIIFSNFKFNVEKISKFLNDNQFPSVAISSLLTQSQRNKVIDQFKAENEHNILVATDVAARGLDIKGVDLVINYELPMDSESYVHRIGRTGRAGTEGKAFSLVSDKDVESLSRIEDYLKHKLVVGWLDESEFVSEFKAFPEDSEMGSGDFRRDGRREDGRRGGSSRGGGRGGEHRDYHRGSGSRGGHDSHRGGDGRRDGRRDNRSDNRNDNRSDNRIESKIGSRQEGRSGDARSGVSGGGRGIGSAASHSVHRNSDRSRQQEKGHGGRSDRSKYTSGHPSKQAHKNAEHSRGGHSGGHRKSAGSHHSSGAHSANRHPKQTKPVTIVSKVKNFFKGLFK